MNAVNNNQDVSPQGFICDAICGAGCIAGGAGGCGWLCALDGPLPFADGAAVSAIATAGGLSGAAAIAVAKSF